MNVQIEDISFEPVQPSIPDSIPSSIIDGDLN